MSLALHYWMRDVHHCSDPHLRNDLYCVEWDVKLYYTIPYHITWLSTIQQDLRSHNLTLPEAMFMAQNRSLWRMWSTYSAMQSWVACQKRRQWWYYITTVLLVGSGRSLQSVNVPVLCVLYPGWNDLSPGTVLFLDTDFGFKKPRVRVRELAPIYISI